MNYSKVNTSTEIPPLYNHKIAIVSATSGFTANKVKITLKEGQILNLQNSPMLVEGFVKDATVGTIFYFYQKN